MSPAVEGDRMSLRLPSEIVVEDVLPTLRVLLARDLAERGLTQAEIAGHLGVTQAAVSKYASGDGTVESRIADHPRTAETVGRVADGLASGSMDGYDALAAVLELVREFEDRGPICELHEEAMPGLRGLGCDLCVRGVDEALRSERETLASVRKAARILATAPGVAGFVPNVGSNVGTALPGAADASDVAAIPGRIYAIGDRVEVPANPEFGASEHVATVLLAATAVDPDRRGAVNLATDDAFLDAARDRGIEPVAFDADYEDRRERLRARFAERGGVPRVLFHRGAFGIEPITYVLGETGIEAAGLAVDLVEAAGSPDGGR
jgi:predicted fused transcriptional regulator/phosphomethylpyrimidine kinase/predicted transcriptional regulator